MNNPVPHPGQPASPTPPPSIRVGLYTGPGTNTLILHRVLIAAGFDVRPITLDAIQSLTPADLHVLYLPGGWYTFPDPHASHIRALVTAGLGVVGTCAGAYVVIENLALIPGRVLRCNMRGRLYLEPQQGNHPILQGLARKCTRHNQRTWEQLVVAHMGGPIMLLENHDHMLASYDFQAELGALAAAPHGQGRAVAIASHPECALPGFSPDDTARHAIEPDDQVIQIIATAVTWAAKRS